MITQTTAEMTTGPVEIPTNKIEATNRQPRRRVREVLDNYKETGELSGTALWEMNIVFSH